MIYSIIDYFFAATTVSVPVADGAAVEWNGYCPSRKLAAVYSVNCFGGISPVSNIVPEAGSPADLPDVKD